MKKIFTLLALLLFALACRGGTPSLPAPILNPTPRATPRSEATAWTAIPTLTVTRTFTPSPSPTLTSSPTPTLELVHQGPESVTLPILLYHRVEPPKNNSKYYIAPEKFEAQMKLLHDWGYVTVTLDMLLDAIHNGADLPARPILLTFDDGQESVYTTAFPIMQRYGFTGIVYIVGTYMDAETFMTSDQIMDLVGAGWEVGSHSMRHKDLTSLDAEERKYEIFQSRKLLSEKLGVPVNSFAYPWGLTNGDVFSAVRAAGYTSGVGVGYTYQQGTWNLYLLQRRDILGTYDLQKFVTFLPWQGDAKFLPALTPTPAP